MTSTGRSEAGGVSKGEVRELSVGDVLGERYRIEGKIGTGGIGMVYRAVQLPLERPVAIKVLHDDLLSMNELRVRFEREARALSALAHPHVVSISDYGIDGDRPFLVMELLEGQTLEEVLRRDPIDPERGVELARQILRGLAFAHSKGIAHRDLKPANVFLSRMPGGREHAKLLDFGLARMVENEGDEELTLTKRGVVFGTPAYMSPEQATGSHADERSDVYSMGALLFELLAGRRPFVGDTRADLLRAHLTSPVPRLASIRPELRCRDDLVDLIDVAMAKEPRDRFVDASDMLAALDAIDAPTAWLVPDHEVSLAPTQMSGKPVTLAPPKPTADPLRWPLILGVVGAIGLVVVGVAMWQPSDEERTVSTQPPVEDEVSAHAETNRPAARDPFEEPPPEPLRPYLRMVEQEHVFGDRAELRSLHMLARAMPEDPRPLLLIGHLYVAKGWYTEGMRRYERAYEVDPSSRGDPRMLATLVMLASRDSVGDHAADLLVEIYGAEARSALQMAIDELAAEPLAQLRLVRVRERLSPTE
jgi:serine/threonine-protein kinase